MIRFFIIIFFSFNGVYSQYPEVKEYMVRYDSITNNNIYYENPKDLFSDKRILLNNKIIGFNTKYLIKNGLVVEETEKRVIKINKKIFYKYESIKIKSLKEKIYCEDNLLRKVDFFKANKLVTVYEVGRYGNNSITNYEHQDWGYYEYLNNMSCIKKYKVKYNYKTQKIINRTFLMESKDVNQESIKLDKNNEYYFTQDNDFGTNKIYSKYCDLCK